MKYRELPLGSISEGTLRTGDLVDAFSDALKGVGFNFRPLANNDNRDLLKWLGLIPGEPKTEPYASAEDWDTLLDNDDANETAGYLLESLENELQNFCPLYAYFGTSEGDGACFGVWADWGMLQEDLRAGDVLDYDNLPDRRFRAGTLAAEVNDHGNVTLYRKCGRGRDEWREVWAIV